MKLEDGTEIKNTMSLLAFAKQFGPKMYVTEFTNKETGDNFDACKFINDHTATLVSFGRKLVRGNGGKALTAQQIAAQKDELEVCAWEKPDGTKGFTLYKPGDPENIGRNNREVNLGL